MATTAAVQQVGSFGFKLEIPVKGLGALTGKTLRVRFQRPDGTIFERTTPTDVLILQDIPTVTIPIIGVKILEGDLTIDGDFEYQVFDETGGGQVKTDVQKFSVASSIPDPIV